MSTNVLKYLNIQLQLSEVIMRTRKYLTDVVGGEGSVISHHVGPEVLEKKFEQACLLSEAPVKNFLDKITYDREGLVNCFPLYVTVLSN